MNEFNNYGIKLVSSKFMQTSLLSTKLYIPPTRETLVPRPRLTDILSSSMVKGFILVSAPAGYGKTTLVSSWLRGSGIPCTWLSLEASDNDPVTFLQYLLAALQVVVPSVRLDLLDLVDGIQPASLQALVHILINQIAAQGSRFVLVLDDFHLVQDQSVLDMVATLLDHLPVQQMHLVLISRADPPLPLSRLRVRGQMVEIRADQLRFTPSEIASFVNGMLGFDLSAEDISAMEVRTEGWIAGLQLAILSMQGCQDKHGFIAAFSGSHHYIVDYLVDEVLKRQDDLTRAFLLQTSILTRMCASLCNSVVTVEAGDHPLDGQSILETMERMNLFIVPLDKERRWYRYHHLFADVLNRRLEYQYPDLLPKLYRRASDWYEKNGLIGESIQYSLDAGDLERAAQLVEQHGCYLLMSGEVLTLIKWMEAVEYYFSAHPSLLIQKGWALTLAGRMEPAEQAFQQAEQLVSSGEPTQDVSSMIGIISAGRAYWADIQGSVTEADRLAQQALDLLPDTDPLSQSMRSVATGVLARTTYFSGDLDRATQIFNQALEIGRAANNVEMIINTNSDISEILMGQGRLGQAEQLLLETLPLTIRPDGQGLPLCAQIYSTLSKINYELNKLEETDYYAQKCLEVSRQWGDIEQQLSGSIMSASVSLAWGEVERTQKWIEAAERLCSGNYVYPWKAIQCEGALDRIWLSLGSVDRVSQRLEANDVQPANEITYRNTPRYLSLLRLLLTRGNYSEALSLAERMLQKAKDGHYQLRVVELLVLQSLAHLGKKDLLVGANTLAQAVMLAHPEKYRRVFLNEGEGMVKLLYLVKSGRDSTGYAQELLKEFDQVTIPTTEIPQMLIEPLSGREIEVLKLIEAGLSNQEIASKLYLSITTVKRHISNIYAKLDVKNRTQAVVRGKELGFFSK